MKTSGASLGSLKHPCKLQWRSSYMLRLIFKCLSLSIFVRFPSMRLSMFSSNVARYYNIQTSNRPCSTLMTVERARDLSNFVLYFLALSSLFDK